MKKKKGFTLVEILGVITILGVLALIAIPTIDNIVTKNREKLYDSQIKTIEDGLKTWANDNAMYLPEEGDDALLISLGILKLAGFVEPDIKNPLTNLCFSNDMQLSISAEKEGYKYYVDEESGLDGTEADCSLPAEKDFIYLKGVSTVKLALNATYVEPGFYTFDANGKLGNLSVTKVIKDKNGNVVTSIDSSTYTAAPYNITYTYGTASVTRTINIGNQVYVNGTAVYFNPVTGAKCTAGEAVSATGTKTGCMKWYAFNDTGVANENINLILDHNTTAGIAWSSNGSAVYSPLEVITQLQTDTSSWAGVPTRTDSYTLNNATGNYTINYNTYKARLITADEIATISRNISFYETTSPDSSWFYLDSNNQTQTVTGAGNSSFAWLFDYTYGCTAAGCNVADSNLYDGTYADGYWTATAVLSTYDFFDIAWYVTNNGELKSYCMEDVDGGGVRPVITIPKSSL
jgi:prepilin-type N-terminal cleavage/methylation domain-containing protein